MKATPFYEMIGFINTGNCPNIINTSMIESIINPFYTKPYLVINMSSGKTLEYRFESIEQASEAYVELLELIGVNP